MINKVVPRKLNQSSDSKIRGKDDMFDAINVSIWGDVRGEDGGNEGVIKPVKSNVLCDGSGAFDESSDKVVLGKIIDNKYDVIYFFVYCTSVNKSGVYAYDPTNYLSPNHQPESIFKVYTTSEFNFHPESFVKGDITYIQKKQTYGDTVYEDAPILFFTDNKNEPRKLNVLRAIYDPLVNNYVSGSLDIQDFITACPKTPTKPPTFTFVEDPTMPYSEFKNVNGFQFAYQLVYKDSNVSAMSTFSEIAVPPSYITQATLTTANLNIHNVCRVTIPMDQISQEVDKVKIVARRGNDGAFFEIKEELPPPTGGFQIDFKNDTINVAVSNDDQIKAFDNLPKRSEAQSIVDNRLFYGNYVEGFDNVQASAIITPVTRERSPDFTNYEIKIHPATCLSANLTANGAYESLETVEDTFNKNAAFVLDPSELPESGLAIGDQITFSFSLTPDQNWHIYDSTESYHQHLQLGDYFGEEDVVEDYTNQYAGTSLFKWAFYPNEGDTVTDAAVMPTGIENKGSLKNWHTSGVVDTEANDGNLTIVYGTSAANPLIVQGGEISISLKIRANALNTREGITEYITHLITGDPLDTTVVLASDFDVVEQDIVNTYSYDLELSNGDLFNQGSPNGRLITMCGQAHLAGETARLAGAFILNKATVELGFFKDEAYNGELTASGSGIVAGEGTGVVQGDNETFRRRIGLYVKKISNVETLTCKRRYLANSPWGVFSGNSATSNLNETTLPSGPFLQIASDLPASNASYNAQDAFDEGEVFNLWNGFLNFTESPEFPFYEDVNREYSLMDGQGGIGGGPSVVGNVNTFDNGYDTDAFFLGPSDTGSGDMTTAPQIQGIANLGSAYLGNGGFNEAANLGQGSPANGIGPLGVIVNNRIFGMPLWRGTDFIASINTSGALTGQAATENIVDGVSVFTFNGVSLFLAHSAARVFNNLFYAELALDEGFRSFKSGANHAFGIVYYDARGRASDVYPLGTALSPPYYSRPNQNYGKVDMQILLTSLPPAYAETFQIVYTGNTSISRFIQYSTHAAFIATDDSSEDNGNIYVSLNYLLGSPISYKNSFGGRGSDGGDPYVYREGDILRVISYYEDEDPVTGRTFVNEQHDFEVLDATFLGGGTDNPLYFADFDGEAPHPAKQGYFVILKNNPNALGFAFEDIRIGENQVNSQSHNWGKRCIVEIFNPADSVAEENQVFYETSNVFDADSSFHLGTPILLTEGDVWWRKVPVNMPNFNAGIFESLIGNTIAAGGNGSESNFQAYSLETEAFNDTVRNADVTGKGKIKIINPNAQEVVRSASITYSDKNNPASSTFTLTSFNPAKLQFKDMPAEYGNINYLVNQQDSIFVIQSSRCSSVPVNRNLITTASNQESLISASMVLGTERYYAGEYGCDDNPESVCVIGSNIYFASKGSREVYKFNPSTGIAVISESGMKSFFRKLFADAEQAEGKVKVVGGYDPIKDEFILSVYNQPAIAYVEPSGQGDVAEGGSVIQDTTTINSLEQQLYNVLHTLVTLQAPAGNNVFKKESLPSSLEEFYDGFTGTNELDYLVGLDSDSSGVFDADEVVSYSDIYTPLASNLEDAVALLESNFLLDFINTIQPAIDGTTVNTPEDIKDYIDGLEADFTGLQGDFNNLQNDLNVLQGNYDALVEANVSNNELITQLNDQVVELTSELNTANINLNDAQDQITGLLEQAGIDTETISELQSQLDAAAVAAALDAQTIANLEAAGLADAETIATLQESLSLSQSEVTSLTAQLATATLQIENLNAASLADADTIVGLNDQIVSLNSIISGLETELAAAQQLDNYDAGFTAGVASVDITSDNPTVYEEGFAAGYADGVASVDVETPYQEGFVAGVASVDITLDNQDAFNLGVASVDITSDNEDAFNEGVASVDTESIYNDGYTQGYIAGVDAGAGAAAASAAAEVNALNHRLSHAKVALTSILTHLLDARYSPHSSLDPSGTIDTLDQMSILDGATDPETENTYIEITNAVQSGLNHLSAWQGLLAASSQDNPDVGESFGLQGAVGYNSDGNLMSYNFPTVTADRVTGVNPAFFNEAGMQGFRNAVDTIRQNITAIQGGIFPEADAIAFDFYISQETQDVIANLLQIDANTVASSTLEEVLATEGISRNELLELLFRLRSPSKMGSDIESIKTDVNQDGVVATADLLLFLSNFGTILDFENGSEKVQVNI